MYPEGLNSNQPTQQKPKISPVAIILVGALILLAVCALTYLLFNVNPVKKAEVAKSETTQDTKKDPQQVEKKSETSPQTYPKDADISSLSLSQNDKTRVYQLNYSYTQKILAISTSLGSMPANSKAIYKYFTDKGVPENPKLDPETNQKYLIVDTAPKRGEIQYAPRRICNQTQRGLGDINTSTSVVFSLVVALDDLSYYCVSNLPS